MTSFQSTPKINLYLRSPAEEDKFGSLFFKSVGPSCTKVMEKLLEAYRTKFCMLFQALQLCTDLFEKMPKNKRLFGIKSIKSKRREALSAAEQKETHQSKRWVL
jgi:hypothetical protein